MATWGAYLKSYVVKEAVSTKDSPSKEPSTEKVAEKPPVFKPIVPLDYGSSQRTIVPILEDERVEDKPAAAPSQPEPTNAGPVARKFFGFGGSSQKDQAEPVQSKVAEIPKMASIVQRAQVQRSQTAVEIQKSSTSAEWGGKIPIRSQSFQPNSSDTTSSPTSVVQQPEQKPDPKLKKLLLARLDDYAKPMAGQTGSSRAAKIFGPIIPIAPKIAEANKKVEASEVPIAVAIPSIASQLQRSTSSASTASMKSDSSGNKSPKSSSPTAKKGANSLWEVLEQAEKEWTTIAPKSIPQTDRPIAGNPWAALEDAEREWMNTTSSKPVLKVKVPDENEVPELSSSHSSTTYSSPNFSGTLSSTRSSVSVGRFFLSPTELKIPEYILRAEEEERKRKALEVEERANRILMEREQMDMELERMRLEEEEMQKEAERIAQEEFEINQYYQEIALSNVASIDQSQTQESTVEADVKLDGPILSPLSKTPVQSPGPREEPQSQGFQVGDGLGRSKSSAKERMERANAEIEAEFSFSKPAGNLVDDYVSDYASEYASVYEDDDDDVNEENAQRLRDEAEEAERLRKEEEEAQLVEEERIAEEARLRRKEREEAKRIEAERIAKDERLRRKEEERLRFEEEEEERLRFEEEEEERLRLEEEEAQRREDERRERELAKKEKLELVRRKREEMEEREAREEARRQEEQNLAREQRKEAQRIEIERQKAELEAQEAEESEEEEETQEDKIRKAEEKIRQAFAGLAAERATPTSETASSSAATTGSVNPYRRDIRGGREPGTQRPSFVPAFPVASPYAGGNLNRSATFRGNLDAEPSRASLARSATTGGRPAIRGGLPGGPKAGLPGGPRAGLPSGPRGGGLPLAPRAPRS